METHLQIQLFYGALIDYDLETAEKILEEIRPSIQHGQGILEGHYQGLLGWLAYFNGHIDHARLHLQEGILAARTSGAPFPEGLLELLLSQVLYAQGHIENAREEVRLANKIGMQIESDLLIFIVQLTSAHFALQEENEDVANQSLTYGMKLARERDFQYFSWWPKNVVTQLCSAALLWNIEIDFVQRLVRKFHFMPEKPKATNPNWPWKIKITTLGHFTLEAEGTPLTFGRKTPLRLLTFLKTLIALGGNEVPETTLADLLWPDADGDLTHQTFATTLHRLRKLLGSDEVLLLKDGKLSLNALLCCVDTWVLEDLVQNPVPNDEAEQLAKMSRLLDLYQGPFLPDAQDEPWSFQARERFRGKFIRAMILFSQNLSTSSHQEMAVILLNKAIKRERSAELLYQSLAAILTSLKRHNEAQILEHEFQKLTGRSLHRTSQVQFFPFPPQQSVQS